jgi:photosystem II stability/assembly factor-like uncharacterized protein
MKRNTLRIALVCFVLISAGILVFKDRIFNRQSFSYNLREHEEGEEKEGEAGISGAMEYYRMLKADPSTGMVDLKSVYAVYDQLDQMPKSKLGSMLNWTEMGPDNVGGRCRSVIFDRDNNNVVYAGGVSGGVWRSDNGGSTWHRFGSRDELNINVTTLCQTSSGSIYYGTGELDFAYARGEGNSGFVGRGIFKMTRGSDEWKQLPKTDPGNWVMNADWSNVNKIMADPTDAGRLYVANTGGFYISSDSGTTWKKATLGVVGSGKDIAISNDGNTIYVVVNNGNQFTTIVRSDDKGATFKKINTGLSSAAVRYVVAISPLDNNVLYIMSAGTNNALAYLYRSDNRGDSWYVIGKGDNVFNPLAQQGYYDACIAVDPTNTDHVVIGGLNLWEGRKINDNYQWNQLTNWNAEFLDIANTVRNSYYVHADQHVLIFDNKNNLYIGSDGGVSKSTDFTYNSKPTFFNADYGFNTLQFYGMGVSAYDKLEVVAGAQDNGVIRVNKNGITLLNGTDIKEGDGGYCAISKINPNIYFAEYINGDIARSFNKGQGSKTWSGFFDNNVPAKGPERYPFIAIFSLWESLNDPTSPDSVTYIDQDNNHRIGETIAIRSKSGVDFNYKLTTDLAKGTPLTVQDKIQSRFFVGANNGIWMTREAVTPGLTPTWFQIASLPGFIPHDIKYTPDGDGVYVGGTTGGGTGQVYLITGLSGKKLSYSGGKFNPADFGIETHQVFNQQNQVVTGIALDENDINHVIIVLGTYGRPTHVYHSFNAAGSNPTFSAIQSNLPAFPVYDALISSTDPKMYFLGTEFGVWSSKNSGGKWDEENEGLERVPVFQLQQRRFETKPWNGPTIYACTHGRGVFMSETLATGIKNKDNTTVAANNLNLYPNPAYSFTNVSIELKQASDVQISMYDLQGRQVNNLTTGRQAAGQHQYRIETSGLRKGTYLVRVKTIEGETSSRLLIMN